jgi:hypothetical protein
MGVECEIIIHIAKLVAIEAPSINLATARRHDTVPKVLPLAVGKFKGNWKHHNLGGPDLSEVT